MNELSAMHRRAQKAESELQKLQAKRHEELEAATYGNDNILALGRKMGYPENLTPYCVALKLADALAMAVAKLKAKDDEICTRYEQAVMMQVYVNRAMKVLVDPLPKPEIPGEVFPGN